VDTPPADRSGVGADERVAAAQPAAEPGVDGLAHQPGRGREEVASEELLGERCLPWADCEVDLLGRGEPWAICKPVLPPATTSKGPSPTRDEVVAYLTRYARDLE
jgi:hypothetical protein